MIKSVQNHIFYNNPGIESKKIPFKNYYKNDIPQLNKYKENNLNLLPQYMYQISFGSNDRDKIEIYLKKQKKKFTQNSVSYKNINLYDLNKLEGIQKDIEIFENLSMKQIKLLANNMTEIALQRGCHNMCCHCYAEAMPPSYKWEDNKINKIDFDDFNNLCNGFKELNKRLGFNILNSSNNEYNTLFHDSDSAFIYLKDKNGKTYDYLDLAKMLYDVSGKEILFDTAGWNIQDKVTQDRIEKLVSKAINSKDYDFLRFCISINPFHALYNKAVKYQKSHNVEKENFFKEIYTTRMANVLFTMSPLIKDNKLEFIARALDNNTKNADGYREKDLIEIYKDILEKLEVLYINDFNSSNPKIIKKKDDIENNLKYIKEGIEEINTNLGYSGRLKKLVQENKKSKITKLAKENEFNNPLKAAHSFKEGLIDINGKFYLTNWYETYPTDIELNYKNKGKITAPISPYLRSEKITKGMLK